MSQTYTMSRAIRENRRGHWHKIHFIVLEDCDAEDDAECAKFCDEGDSDRIFEAIKKTIGFDEEKGQ